MNEKVRFSSQASLVNLVAGLILFSLGIGITLITSNVSGSSLVGPISLVLIFIFLGGYGIDKFAESCYKNKIKNQRLIEVLK